MYIPNLARESSECICYWYFAPGAECFHCNSTIFPNYKLLQHCQISSESLLLINDTAKLLSMNIF